MTLKILNLYSGIGGNRKLWSGDIEVTAVEKEASIAECYKHHFPNDIMIIGDAHEYLLRHFSEFDFIWSSPPCPSHSVFGKLSMLENKKSFCYPDMALYQEILFLTAFFKGRWVVENTKSYYPPLIKPYISGNHFFWSDFFIGDFKESECRAVNLFKIHEKEKRLGFVLDDFSFKEIEGNHKKDKVLNNCVEPNLGLHIFNMAFKSIQTKIKVSL